MSDKLSERVRNAIASEGPRTNNAAALADEVTALEQRVERLVAYVINRYDVDGDDLDELKRAAGITEEEA